MSLNFIHSMISAGKYIDVELEKFFTVLFENAFTFGNVLSVGNYKISFVFGNIAWKH